MSPVFDILDGDVPDEGWGISSTLLPEKGLNSHVSPSVADCCTHIDRLKPPQRTYCDKIEAMRSRITYAIQDKQEVTRYAASRGNCKTTNELRLTWSI